MPTARAFTIATLLCAIGLLGCQDPAEKLAEHLERGKQFAADGRYTEAVIEYRNALAVDPTHADTHWAMALAYRDAGEPAKAFWELQETVRLDPENVQAKIFYSRTLALGSSEEALGEAVVIAEEAVGQAPSNPEAQIALGRALQAVGRYADADVAFREAARLAPGSAEPLRRLANVHRIMGDHEDAERVYREAVEVEPDYASYINLAVLLLGLEGRALDAEDALRSAVDTASGADRVQAVGVYAGFLISTDRTEEAEQALQAQLDEFGRNQPELVYALASLRERRGDFEDAETVLQAAAEAAPGEVGPQLTLAAFRDQHGDPEGAMRAVDDALAIDPTDPAARLRRASLMGASGIASRDAAAITLARRILDELIDSGGRSVGDALAAKGRLDLAEGKYREAEVSLRRAIDLNTLSWREQYLLGAALFARGDALHARTELARADALGGNGDAFHSLRARVHAALGEPEVAVEIGRNTLRRAPEDVLLRLALVQAYLASGRGADARALIAEVPVNARDPRLHFANGRLEQRAGNRIAARESFEAAWQLDPTRPGILAALLELDALEGRLDESADRIDGAASQQPDNAKLVRLQARVSLLGSDLDAAKIGLERAIQLDPNDLQSYNDLAGLLARSGETAAVVETYERALDANPEQPQLNLLIGMLYERRGRLPDAIARYEVAASGAKGLALAKNNLAYLLAETGGDLGQALVLATEAKERFPDDANVADTLGWVLHKKGLTTAAIGYLREAERKTPPGDAALGMTRLHLAVAYEANGETDNATQALARALEPHGPDPAPDDPPWAAEARAMLDRLRGA